MTGSSDQPAIAAKALPATMVLVIGIILGAFVAMVLIVIIVLKMRTRVDGNGTLKCEEHAVASAPRYQFAPPNDYGELGGPGGNGGVESERDTATTALMEGASQPRGPGGPGGPMGRHNNGFFNNNCSSLAAAAQAAQVANGDRSRLFRKSNGSKPVREWYV